MFHSVASLPLNDVSLLIGFHFTAIFAGHQYRITSFWYSSVLVTVTEILIQSHFKNTLIRGTRFAIIKPNVIKN